MRMAALFRRAALCVGRKMLYACIMAGAIVICGALKDYWGMEDDNFIEESIENVIEIETGIDFDATPESPEHT